MSEAKEKTGATISLTPPKKGDIMWEAKQAHTEPSYYAQDKGSSREINWSRGPHKIIGSLDTNTYHLSVGICMNGINIDNIEGNLKDGVGVKFNFRTTNGEVKLFLKNGIELWTYHDIKITFDGYFYGDYKILSI